MTAPESKLIENEKKNASAMQMNAPSFRIAALDQEFLLGDSMRGVRFQLEYSKAEEALRAWGIRSTVVVFGSARVREDGPGQQAHWYQQARDFGRICSLNGGALGRNRGFSDNVIATGGGPGLMEAANRGARDAGAPSIGFNITLPREQIPNPYTTPQLTFRFHYFAMRKMHLAMRARALVVFPGGYGTLDELFEMLNLRVTEKAPPAPIVMVDRDYWRRIVNFDAMVEAGTIDARDLELFCYADSGEEAWAALERRGLGLPPASPPKVT